MFRITRGSGFQITLPNGLMISTQFGYGTFCTNGRSFNPYKEDNSDFVESPNAEVAITDENGEFITSDIVGFGCGEYVGYIDVEIWIEILKRCLEYKKGE